MRLLEIVRSRCFSPPLSESNSPSVRYVAALKMAEGREPGYLSPLEEQFIQESETDEDIDQQLLREREMAAHRLWASFQDSAMAVSHLFRGVWWRQRPLSLPVRAS